MDQVARPVVRDHRLDGPFLGRADRGFGGGFVTGGVGEGMVSGIGGTYAEGGRPPVGVPSIIGERGRKLWDPMRPVRSFPTTSSVAWAAVVAKAVLIAMRGVAWASALSGAGADLWEAQPD
jgi:hypothetical protein